MSACAPWTLFVTSTAASVHIGMNRFCCALLASLGLTACGDEGSPGSGDEDASESSGTDPSTTTASTTNPSDPSDPSTDPSDPTVAEESSSEGGSESVDGSTTDAPASCGDGIVDDGEICDDGNEVDGDGCNVDCVESGSLRWELVHAAPGGGNDCAYDVAINAAGQIAIAGEAQSSDLDTYDVLALSIDPAGTLAWEMVYDSASTDESGGGATDRGYGVAIEDDGEVIVAGHEYLDIETVWIRKLDAVGETVWTRTGLDTHAGRGYAVTLGANDEVFVAGTHGLYAFVTKYNSNGVEFWTEERKGSDGCNGCDHFGGVRAYDDGGVLVAGSFDNADADAAIVRLDTDGNDVWSDVIDAMGKYGDYAGGLVAAGTSTLAIVQLGTGGAPELRSYADDGELEWTLPDAMPGTDGLRGIDTTADGGWVALGSTWSQETGVVVIVRRFAADGAVLWERELPAGADVYREVRGIAVAPDSGDIAVVGCTAQAAEYADAWVAVLAP